MEERERQQAIANTITGLQSVFIKRLVIKHNETANSTTETVFTSQISVLGPVTSIKLFISAKAQRAVKK